MKTPNDLMTGLLVEERMSAANSRVADSLNKRAPAPLPLNIAWSAQYMALCRKHYALAWRNYKSSLAQIFMGLAVCLLLLMFQQIANVVLGHQVPHPPSSPVAAPPRCLPGVGGNSVRANMDGSTSFGCNTILYAPWTPLNEEIMQRVCNNTGLLYGVDVVPFPGATRGPSFHTYMANVSESNSTTCVVGGCDMHNPPLLECMPCDFARDNATMTDWLLQYPNSTQNSVFFFGSYFDDTAFGIFYNLSVTQFPFFGNAHTVEVKRALDQALVELTLESAGAPGSSVEFDLRVNVRNFPTPTPRLINYDVFAANGGQWCFVVPMVTFFSVLVDLVHEKEAKLRIGMRQMGLRTSAFWASWLTYGIAMSLLSTIVLQASGYAIGFDFFRNSNFFVTFLMFMQFNVAMLALALFLSSLMTSAKTAQTVGYSAVLIGFVLQFILTSAYAGLVDLLYSDSLASWVRVVRFLLERYPAFNFSKMFYDVSTLSSSTIDTSAGKLVPGPGFYWSDMYLTRLRTFFGFNCVLPAPVQSLYYQLADTAIFLVLAFYLDAVLPGPHGSPAHPLFFLGCRFRSGRFNTDTDDGAISVNGGVADTVTDPGVLAERIAAAHKAPISERIHSINADTHTDGVNSNAGSTHGDTSPVETDEASTTIVRISHLRVVYRKGWSAAIFALTGWDTSTTSFASLPCCRRRHAESLAQAQARREGSNSTGATDVVAVHDLSLTVKNHEILVLLGHNGAGKSTTISVLTGLLQASQGTAEVYGYDVNTQAEQVQKVMGVCPQHDILWPTLSAQETLELFAAIKGLPHAQTAAEIRRVLHEVRLTTVCHQLVGGYSGGMKRRLSVAVAALGCPKVIYLDEPTTGMDPVNRLKCWRLIQRLKVSSAIVLTTHNMEEANVLGTRVGIMAHGRLAALGTPLRLKSLYGAGYRLNLVLRDASDALSATAQSCVKRIAPTASITLRDAANLAFTLPFADISKMPGLLDWAEASRVTEGENQPNESSRDSATLGATTPTSTPESFIQEYSVSGPNLESVFITVSAAAHFDLAQSTPESGREAEHAPNGEDDIPVDTEEEGDIVSDLDANTREGTVAHSDILTGRDSHINKSGDQHRTGATQTSTLLHKSTTARAPIKPQSFSHRALVIKNLTLITRQRGLCICQIITPLLVLGLLILLQHIIKVEATGVSIEQIPSLLLPLNMNQWYPVTTSIPINIPAADNSGLSPLSTVSHNNAWGARWAASTHSTTSEVAHTPSSTLSAAERREMLQQLLSSVMARTALQTSGKTVEDMLPVDDASVASMIVSRIPSATACFTWFWRWFAPAEAPVTATSTVSDRDASFPNELKAAGVQLEVEDNELAPHPPYPPYPEGYDTDCLTFFLYTVTPDGTDGNNASSLGVLVGGQPQLALPWPTPSPLPKPRELPNNNATSLLGAIATNWCQLKNHSLVNAPFFAPRLSGSAGSVDDELMADLNILNNASNVVLDYQAPCGSPSDESWGCPAYILPDATLDFHAITLPQAAQLTPVSDSAGTIAMDVTRADTAALPGVTRLQLSYTLQVNDLVTTRYHRPNNFSRLGLPEIPEWASRQALTVDPARVALMDSVLRGFVASATTATAAGSNSTGGMPEESSATATGIDGATNAASSQRLRIGLPSVVAVGTFPQVLVTNLEAFVEIVGAVLHPIALTLQLPLFVFITVMEKEERLVELQLAMGLRYPAYVAISYGLNMLLYCIVAGTFWAAGHALQFTFFAQTSQWLLFLAFFGWGLALCSLAAVMSACLWSRKAATVVGYVVALFGNLFAIIIAAGIYGSSLPYSLGQPMPIWLYSFPVFGLVRFLYLGTFDCVAKVACIQDFSQAMSPGSEIRTAILSLYLDAAVYFIVALYLDQVLPRKYGVPKEPFFCLRCKRRGAAGDSDAGQNAANDSNIWHYVSRWAGASGVSDYARGEDASVRGMREEVNADLWPAALHARSVGDAAFFKKYPVILSHVRKEFDIPKPKRAAAPPSKWWQLRKSPPATATITPLGSINDDGTSLLTVAECDGPASSMHRQMGANTDSGLYDEREQAVFAAQGKKVAVSDFTLAISAGTCFGLLGSNGAGKSTLISMLMGLYAPSGGDALINGYRMAGESDQVRLSIGICMQQDILWETLSVEEHLFFYARVKGVPPATLAAHVHASLRRVGLFQFKSRLARDLSGGMKRRLSLAIALIGDSRIILADEVTTGLDPSSRRTAWRILEGAKRGRVIILVSHDMAEMEVLSNTMGIMTFGRLRCLGTQQHLKSVYGGGYILSVNYSLTEGGPGAAGRVKIAIEELFPGALVDGEFTGFISFVLPSATVQATAAAGVTTTTTATAAGSSRVVADTAPVSLSQVFVIMSRHASECGITDWGVGQVTLDTVFQRVVKHYRAGVPSHGTNDSEDDE